MCSTGLTRTGTSLTSPTSQFMIKASSRHMMSTATAASRNSPTIANPPPPATQPDPSSRPTNSANHPNSEKQLCRYGVQIMLSRNATSSPHTHRIPHPPHHPVRSEGFAEALKCGVLVIVVAPSIIQLLGEYHLHTTAVQHSTLTKHCGHSTVRA